MATDKCQQELKTLRRKFYVFEMHKHKEIKQLEAENRRLKADKEKVASHSKSQGGVTVQQLRQACSQLDVCVSNILLDYNEW